MVERAARALVVYDHAADWSTVTVPVFYPSGAAATITVSGGVDRFFVSDGGLAHLETEMIGGDRLFQKHAKAIAEGRHVQVDGKAIVTEVTEAQLPAGIADVAAASVTIATRVCERVASRLESELTDNLYGRLVALFGEPKVERSVSIVGASNHSWRVSAKVNQNGKQIVFEAVSNHHSSVYSAATMFHDLNRLEPRPLGVAVVKDKGGMGDYLGMLAQAAHVIQDDVPDEALYRLAAA